VLERAEERGIGVSLATPDKIRTLQRALYVKAKQEPTRRFHALYDKVWREDILAYAYARCRANGGAPGVDGVTFSHIDVSGVGRWLDELREEVRTGRDKPQPVRRVMIPKSSGVGQRPLGIPTIRDRVVQTAATLVIEPIFQADFDEAAYGYRPKRSALDASPSIFSAAPSARCTRREPADATTVPGLRGRPSPPSRNASDDGCGPAPRRRGRTWPVT
jgi:RNA-directed DNA polymerase